MNQNNVKNYTLGLFIALIALVSGISYAYFTASFQNLGTREASITLAELGSLKLTAEEASYSSGEQYPGDIAIQKFEVEPVTKGKGVYEIDLTGVIDEAIFGTDVEVSLYKSIDNTEVTVSEGELTQEGSNFSRVDTLVTNGLTPVYTGSLKNGLNILFQEEFEVISESSTLKIRQNSESTAYPKYTFYLVYNYKNNGNQNNQMGKAFTGTISGKIIEEKTVTSLDTLELLQELNPNLVVTTSTSENPDFSIPAPRIANVDNDGKAAQTSGLFETIDDYGTSYYFRGDVTNNYVKFGKWQVDSYVPDGSTGPVANKKNEDFSLSTLELKPIENSKENLWLTYNSYEACMSSGASECIKNASAGDDMYWRIIRINGDGSIRMIYDGTRANGNTDEEDNSTIFRSIGTSKFNENSNDNAYVGYMYGTPGSDNYNNTHANTNSSTIKTYLDTWYENNIKNTANEAYLADAIFCNDRSVASADTINYENTNWNSTTPYTTNAFGTNWTMYGTRGRQIEQFDRGQGNKAILTCPDKNDAFTVSDTAKGNGALSYPIGLITQDEANIAGGVRGGNDNYYLTTGHWYWTGSPSEYSSGYASVREVGSVGGLWYYTVRNVGAVRPVLNLKSDSLMLGSGVVSDPFRVS